MDDPSRGKESQQSPLAVLALHARLSKQLSLAEQIAEFATRQTGDFRDHLVLGSLLEQTGRLGAAEQAYRSALELDQGSSFAHCRLGMLYMKYHQPFRALDQFSLAFESNPEDPAALQSIITFLAQRGWAWGALEEANLLREDDNLPSVNLALDLARVTLASLITPELDRTDSERLVVPLLSSLLDSTLERPPSVQLGVARALIELDHPIPARDILRRLQVEKEDHANLVQQRFVQGLLAEKLGDVREALKRYREVLVLQPDRLDACQRGLVLCLEESKTGNRDELLKEGLDLLEIVSTDDRVLSPVLLLLEAALWYAKSREAKSRQALQEMLELQDADDPLAMLARHWLEE